MNTTERIGVSKVQLIVYEKLHWIFREQPIDDCGIDAHIELMDDNCATGKLIAAQIKSGESYFANESNNEIVYYIDEKHLNYWKSNVLPVIIVLYNPKTEECIWEYIGRIKEKNKIYICRLHRFNENAKEELSKIANVEPYKIAQIHRRNYIEKNKSLEVLKESVNIKKKIIKEDCIFQIAIDFGTTRTMFGIISESGEVNLIKTSEGKNYFNTVIAFDENYQYYIGEDALKRKYDPATTVICNFKRDIGLKKEYMIFGLKLSTEDITTLFFQTIINYIEIEYNIIINECIISNPIDFSYMQKRVYEQCLKKCGLSIIRNISESTAVYIDKNISQEDICVIVIDMGGGTFDISVISSWQGVIEVIDIEGDRALGGLDYDIALEKYIKQALIDKYPKLLIDSSLENQIFFKAEEIKILLSSEKNANVIFTECYDMEIEETTFCSIEINRSDFREITSSLNDKLKSILIQIKEYIKKFKDHHHYDTYKIILDGLGSKIFTVKESIEECFPNIPIVDLHSDKKLINGLTTYLKKLKYGNKLDILLLDVLGYDIEVRGEELFYIEDMKEINAIKHLYSFTLGEKTTKLVIALRNITIPFHKRIYFGITYNQQISITTVCGKHQDNVLACELKSFGDKTIYKIELKSDFYRHYIQYVTLIREDDQKIIKKFEL